MKLSVSERLNMLLTTRKINRQEFIEKTQMSRSRLYRILSGNEDSLTPKDLIAISNYFNVSCDYLLFGETKDTDKSLITDSQTLECKQMIIKEISRLSPENTWAVYLFIEYLNNRH